MSSEFTAVAALSHETREAGAGIYKTRNFIYITWVYYLLIKTGFLDNQHQWEWEIRPEQEWFQLNLSELWQYKDLLLRFVRRDLIANYQQTILGPFWIFLQPLLTTFVYFLIFGRVAKISTDGIPPILFYLPGVILWTFFSECLNGTMYTFLNNTHIFSKVYFPRLIVPLSIVVSQSVRFGIQLFLFFVVFAFHLFVYHDVQPSLPVLLLPLLVLLTAAFGLGCGLLISVFTARYRDLDYALQFLIRLFMFAAPVVYPVSIVPEKYRFLFWLNPLTPVIETFRSIFLTGRPLEIKYLLVSIASVFVILVTGLVLFKKREVEVMDII